MSDEQSVTADVEEILREVHNLGQLRSSVQFESIAKRIVNAVTVRLLTSGRQTLCLDQQIQNNRKLKQLTAAHNRLVTKHRGLVEVVNALASALEEVQGHAPTVEVKHG